MLTFWRVFRILIIVALVCSLPFLIAFIGAAIEGNMETYQMTQEQLAQEQFGFILMISVVVFIDGILALLLAFVGRRIKKIKALGNP
jgi:ABC-type multidrug transport system permease subunit